MASLLHAGSADVATALLSNVGHAVVIRVVLNALRLAHRRTVHAAVLEEAYRLSASSAIAATRAVSRNLPFVLLLPADGAAEGNPVVRFGRQFLDSKKSAVLLKGGALLLRCLGNGRVLDVVDFGFEDRQDHLPDGHFDHSIRSPLSTFSYDHAAVTTILTRQGEVLVAMGARICFSWDAASWRLYPAHGLAESGLPAVQRKWRSGAANDLVAAGQGGGTHGRKIDWGPCL